MCVISGFCAAVGGLRGVFARRVGLLAAMTMCAAAMPAAADTITVVNTQDAGAGSLRAAIEAANNAANSTIEFNIPASDPGFNLPGSPNAWRITVSTGLPALSQPVTINGLTQAGAVCGTPTVELNGRLAGTTTYGLVALADGCEVRGLSITDFFLGGVLLQSADNCRVTCNNIGLTGSGSPAGNGRGVVISNAGNNTVGGADAPGTSANRIAFNTGAGVAVTGLSPTPIGNYVLGNAIHDNGGLGIDLADNGVTPNDQTDLDLGPNGLQNFPVIQSVVNNVISGTLNSLPDRMFRIEFFASAAADLSTFGEGAVFLGSVNVSTGATGIANGFTFPFTPPANARFIAATATALPAPRGVPGVPPTGTSEFSGAVEFFTGGGNNPPVANNLSSTTPEDTDVVLTLPASDPDNDTLAVRVATLPTLGSLLQFGSLTPISIAGTTVSDPARRVVFRPAPEGSGMPYASFTFIANDTQADSNTATVTINVTAVNDPPVAVDDGYTTAEDTTLAVLAPGVLGNDSDIDTAAAGLRAEALTQPLHGTLTLNASGAVQYVPADNYQGPDSFTYRVLDDGDAPSNTATVRITVTPVNDAPVALDDAYSTDEDAPLVVSTRATGVLNNDTDIDTPAAALTATALTQPSGGMVAMNPDGTLTYTPSANFNGADSFTYRVSDGELNSAAATVRITVRGVNDAPVAVADAYSTDEDTALVVSTRAAGVLNNDTDIDTPTAALTAAGVSQPGHGNVTLNGDGTFTYTPNANYEGTDSFTYRANDGDLNSGPATVTITVRGTNDSPVAVDDGYTTDEDTPLTVSLANLGVLGNDSDPDGPAPLTAVLVSTTTRGTLTFASAGTFNYNPNPNFNGVDTFTYRARDGAGAESGIATVTITIGAVNDPPVARNDTFLTDEDAVLTVNPPGVLDNDSDADNPLNTLLITVQAQPGNGTVSLANGGMGGGFVYTPNANFNGNDSFTYRLNDGQANSNTATVTIVVRPLNDAPVANDDVYSTPEDTVLMVAALQGVLANDTDVDSPASALTASGLSLPSHGVLVLSPDGSLVYTPDADFAGVDTFTYRANDGQPGGGSNVATVTITVGAMNDPPVAVNDSYFADRNTPLVVSAPGVLGNDTDPDSPLSSLTAIGASLPAHGVLSLMTSGGFTYTPDTDYQGPDSFTYRASDGTDQSGIAVVSITVRAGGQNLPPIARCRDITIDARATCPPPEAFLVTAAQVNNGSSDPDNDVGELRLSLSNTGPFRVGATQVTLTVTDPEGLFSTCTATITVLGDDCNRNGIPDACDIANGAPDCNRDGVPDECQCLWDNGTATPTGAKSNSLGSHQGGGRGNGRLINTRTADDFYLAPGQVHQITSFSGQMLTSVLPSVRRARVDFFEDCDGRPADAPFATFTNSVVLDSIPVPLAGDGFDLVTFSFDLCDAKLWLDGDRTYWVALSGLGLCGDQSESYWATTTVSGNPSSQLKCSVPHRQTGDAAVSNCYQTAWNPWSRSDVCCGGCADMAFKLGGRSCDIIWDNGDAEHCPPVNVAGIPSGTQGGRLLRAADNFVIRDCQDRRLCFVEATIFTNASAAVIQSTGFLEIFTNKCDWPRLRVATARVCKVVPTHAMVTVDGTMLNGYKLQFIAPDMNITLTGGQTYWLSAGVNPGGGFATKSYFAYGRRCEFPLDCNYQITPAAMATPGSNPDTSNLIWCAGSAALDLAFRIASDPLRGPMMPPPPASACPVDFDGSGVVSIQDLFDFVTGWLAGCP